MPSADSFEHESEIKCPFVVTVAPRLGVVSDTAHDTFPGWSADKRTQIT
jgi:hypothetical protein